MHAIACIAPSAAPACPPRRWPSAATSSAGPPTRRRRSRLLDAFVDARLQPRSTRPTSTRRWVPGHAGGESETIIGRWLKRQRQARPRADRHQGRQGRWATARTGLSRALDPPGGGRFAAPPADRPHRSVPVARRRPGHAARGDAGDLRRADPRRQGARDRRLEPHGRAPGAKRWTPARASACRATRRCSRCTTWSTASPTRPSSSRWCASTGLGVINFFGLARGFLTGKYRSEADLAKSPRGAGVKQAYFNERGLRILAALDDAAAALQRHAGAGGAGLADGAARAHGADRQRDLGGAARGADGRRAPDARRGDDRRARRRQRLALTQSLCFGSGCECRKGVASASELEGTITGEGRRAPGRRTAGSARPAARAVCPPRRPDRALRGGRCRRSSAFP